VTGGGEGAGHEDVGAVVGYTDADVGVGDEFAEEDGESAGEGRDPESVDELQ
jgi:hypothetical protein